MSKIVNVLRLKGLQIDGSAVSCTGEQVKLLVEAFISVRDDCVWYAADVDAFFPIPQQFKSGRPSLLGDNSQLIMFAEKVPQFLGGIFLAVPITIPSPVWRRIYDTEDQPSNEMDAAILEIRAFDTSYFEVYAQNMKLLQTLANKFRGVIESI